MSLVIRTMQREKERIENMLAGYSRQLTGLPKGAIVRKTVGQNVYYYLKYRDGKKVVTDYLGKDGDKVQRIKEELMKRRHIQAMVAHLRSELALAERVLEG